MILFLFFTFPVITRIKINYLCNVLQHTESIFCAIQIAVMTRTRRNTKSTYYFL